MKKLILHDELTINPFFSSVSSTGFFCLAISSACDPIAACTVAFGNHANGIKIFSFLFNPKPKTDTKDATTLKARPITRTANPNPEYERNNN